jgi:hypothetical protein
MADFYSDSHVSFDMLGLIEIAGHTVVKSQAVGLRDAEDHEHLWYAAQHQRIVISSDTGFAIWYRMWLFFARAWKADVHHAGILIIPSKSRFGVESATQAIDSYVRDQSDLTDQCFMLLTNGSWQRKPDL